MAWTCTFASCTLLVLLLLGLSSQSCHGLGTFGFDIHHRYSDPVKTILGSDGLPEKGSIEYYAAMARRDRIIRGRHLAASDNQSPLTFANGNMTFFDPSFYPYDPKPLLNFLSFVVLFSFFGEVLINELDDDCLVAKKLKEKKQEK
nr:aspartyl protease family protein 1 [Quercus suber]